jgi:hypothetical protein
MRVLGQDKSTSLWRAQATGSITTYPKQGAVDKDVDTASVNVYTKMHRFIRYSGVLMVEIGGSRVESSAGQAQIAPEGQLSNPRSTPELSRSRRTG